MIELQLAIVKEENNMLSEDLTLNEINREMILKRSEATQTAVEIANKNAELKLTDLKTDAALARSELVNTVHQKLKLSLQVETTEDNLEEAIKERMKKRLCV